MSSDARFRRAKDIFERAVELRGTDLAVFVDRACAGDAELAAEIAALLKADTSTAALPELMPVTLLATTWTRAEEALPALVAGYRIIERLGEGGMGVVYLAEQETPIRRRVALKLIRPGVGTKEVLSRFQNERQALALMSHANIAAVFDAGSTPEGSPYFVMEYVPGEPITAYCDKHRLSLRERLALFGPVCQAVQHAHQKGIIHRDIKPSNVLVTVRDGIATPKVIDFGVAKATNQHLTEHTVFTHQGMLIGTPEYMSPEQAEMSALDIDTRADIYSLGVLLYELLTGTLPFDPRSLRNKGYAEIQRIIREVEPPKPSTRLSSASSPAGGIAGAQPPDSNTIVEAAAARRQTDARTLIRHVRGDLDWIVMKALEKDRTRRYGSATELAADVTRHLTGEPVSAGPPTFQYRAVKFLRRYRAAAFASATFATTLMVAAIGMSWLYLEANSARRNAEVAERVAKDGAARTERTNKFLRAVVRLGDPISFWGTNERGATTDLRDVLLSADSRIDEFFADDPVTAAGWRSTIGQTLLGIGPTDKGLELLVAASNSFAEQLGELNPKTLACRVQLMRGYGFDGRHQEALALGEMLLPQIETISDEESRRELRLKIQSFTIDSTAALGWHEKTLRSYDEFIALQGQAYEPGQLNSAGRGRAAWAMLRLGRREDALALCERNLKETLEWAGSDHLNTIYARETLLAVSKLSPATMDPHTRIREHLKLWNDSKRVFGKLDLRTIHKGGAIAQMLIDADRNLEGAAVLRDNIALRREALGLAHFDTRWAVGALATLLAKDNREGPFLAECEAAASLARDMYGEDSSDYVGEVILWATALEGAERFDAALETVLTVKRIVLSMPERSIDTQRAWLEKLDDLLGHFGRLEEAEQTLAAQLLVDPEWVGGWARVGWRQVGLKRWTAGEASYRRAIQLEPRPNGSIHCGLAEALRGQDRLDEAMSEVEVAERFAPDWSNPEWTRGAIAQRLIELDQRTRAATLLRTSIVRRRQLFSVANSETRWAVGALATLLAKDNREDPFLAECEAAASLARDVYGEDSSDYVGEVILWATALEGAERFDAALEALSRVRTIALSLPPAHIETRRTWIERSDDFLGRLNRLEDARQGLAAAVAEDPSWAGGWSRLGWRQLNLSQWPAAERSYRQAIHLKLDPDASIHRGLAEALRGQRKLIDALGEIEIAERVSPEWADAAWIHGLIELDLDRPVDAAASLQRAVRLAPMWSDPRARLGVALYRCGEKLQAADSFVEATRLDANWCWPHFEAGRCFVELGRFAEAEQFLSAACAMDARWGDHWLFLARALEGMQKALDATCVLDSGISAVPDRADLRSERERLLSTLTADDLNLYEQINRLRAEHIAQSEVRLAIDRLEGGLAERRQRLHQLASRVGTTRYSANDAAWRIVRLSGRDIAEYERGLKLVNDACSPKPSGGWPSAGDDPAVLNTLGVAYFRTGRDAEAVAALNKSNAQSAGAGRPELPHNWAFLALSYRRLGDESAAEQARNHFDSLASAAQWVSDPEIAAMRIEITRAWADN